jgi:hypothetical protein
VQVTLHDVAHIKWLTASPKRSKTDVEPQYLWVQTTSATLMGKVCCKVDASYGAIAVGDLLTTSPTSGHAMKVSDPVKAFGGVIGKALGILAEGRGVVPIWLLCSNYVALAQMEGWR